MDSGTSTDHSFGNHTPLQTRRRVLAGIAAGAALAMGGAASGCSLLRPEEAARTSPLGADGNVKVLNWPDYIDASLLAEIPNLQTEYSPGWEDNYTGWDIISGPLSRNQTPEFDIAVPTNWRAAQMVESGLAEELPLELIPNHVNVAPAFLTNSWDRGARFNMPWQAGITGIAYDPDQTGGEITSVNDLFDPAFAGRVGMIGEMREAVGLAMLADGADPARATKTAAEAALDRIERADAEGQFGGWVYNDFAERLSDGDFWLTMAWSGDAIVLLNQRPNLRFVIPDEGAIRWFDTMVILANSPRIAGAARFMNHFYDPSVAARLTAFTGYTSPVLGAQDEMLALGGEAAELAVNPAIFPDSETERRLFAWDGLDAATDTELDDRFSALLP